MAPRLDENWKAVKLRRQNLESGKTGPDEDTRSVQALGSVFLEYKSATFWSLLNILKSEYFDEDGMV